MKTVLVGGHLCLDITPAFPADTPSQMDQLFSPGKLIQMGKADIHTGGAVSNTGLAMKQLLPSTSVRLVAKIGDDAFGHIVQEKLLAYNQDNILVKDNDADTSYSVVLAVPGKDRIFLHHSGANDTFCSEDVSDQAFDDVCHFHFGYPPLMRRMYEDNGIDMANLFQRAKQKGITTSLDMAGVDPNSPSAQTDWRAFIQRVIPYVDFFLPSAEELCFMLDEEKYKQWNQRAAGRDVTEVLDIDCDIKPLADALISMGARVVLIKCGAKGIYYRTNSQEKMESVLTLRQLQPDEWCAQEGFEESFLQPNIVSTTGAGDTSIAGFLTAMLEGWSLKRCVAVAAATGACCISSFDALSGLVPLDELLKQIDAGWPKRTD